MLFIIKLKFKTRHFQHFSGIKTTQTRVIIQLRLGALQRLDLPAAEKVLLNELTRRLNSLVGSSHTFVGSLVQTEHLFGARMRKLTFVHTHTHTPSRCLSVKDGQVKGQPYLCGGQHQPERPPRL